MITLEDFQKLDLKIATIVRAEAVPNSDKLVKLQIDLGSERRQIVAGIRKSYSPEELVGKQIVVVANLKPTKLMGELSEGMLLAAAEGETPIILTPEKNVKNGSKIR